MSRTIEDVKREYTQSAMAVGQLDFQISESEKQLEFLEQEKRKQKDKMGHLNREALKLQEAEMNSRKSDGTELSEATSVEPKAD